MHYFQKKRQKPVGENSYPASYFIFFFFTQWTEKNSKFYLTESLKILQNSQIMDTEKEQIVNFRAFSDPIIRERKVFTVEINLNIKIDKFEIFSLKLLKFRICG